MPDRIPPDVVFHNKIHQSTRDKLDKAARIKAQMLTGQWDWGNRKPPRHGDGSLYAPAYLVLKEAGFYNSTKYYQLLHHEYFLNALRRELQRLEGGYKKELAELTQGGDALKQLSEVTWNVLMDRLLDPEQAARIKTSDLVTLYKNSTELEAKLAGDMNTRDPHVSTKNVFDQLSANGGEMIAERVRMRVEAKMESLQERGEIIEGKEVIESEAAE